MVTDVAYLDYNATAPLRPEARSAMVATLALVGNASSQHVGGRRAAGEVGAARRQIAALIGSSPGEVVFTSGATESNNLALSLAHARGSRIVTSAVEHPAILETAKALTGDSTECLSVVGVSGDGQVDLDELHAVVARGGACLVSIMAANNETGVLCDLDRIVSIAHQGRALVHTDATQLVGRMPINVADLDVDLLSLSAHKFGGPQGVGALFIRRGLALSCQRLLYGGGQERGWRAGTLNVAGIVGAGAAAAAASAAMPEEMHRIRALRDHLEASLVARVPHASVNGHASHRLPGTTSITFPAAPADAVMTAMPHIAVSDGSACSSGAPGVSHVLLAMGISPADAEATLRFSLGHATTSQEVDRAIEDTVSAVQAVRSALVPR